MSSKADPTVAKVAHNADGSWRKHVSTFRDTIEKGGEFEPEKGRYHLYVALVCPWAHRTLITRKLKGLEDIISVTVLSPTMGDDGWAFKSADPFPGTEDDPNMGAKYLRELYFAANEDYQGRFTVPVLWDKTRKTIVNNESSEIIRNLNTAFDELVPEAGKVDLYPEALRKEIDEVNDWMYEGINVGVYKAGFAATQSAYEDAVRLVFKSLDRLEGTLKVKPQRAEYIYIVGDQLTEADVRAYVTIIRFDVAYHGNFKCNFRTIRYGYPAISLWLRKLYWKNPAFHDTTDFTHIKAGYYASAAKTAARINPTRIVPLGPVPDIEPL